MPCVTLPKHLQPYKPPYGRHILCTILTTVPFLPRWTLLVQKLPMICLSCSTMTWLNNTLILLARRAVTRMFPLAMNPSAKILRTLLWVKILTLENGLLTKQQLVLRESFNKKSIPVSPFPERPPSRRLDLRWKNESNLLVPVVP